MENEKSGFRLAIKQLECSSKVLSLQELNHADAIEAAKDRNIVADDEEDEDLFGSRITLEWSSDAESPVVLSLDTIPLIHRCRDLLNIDSNSINSTNNADMRVYHKLVLTTVKTRLETMQKLHDYVGHVGEAQLTLLNQQMNCSSAGRSEDHKIARVLHKLLKAVKNRAMDVWGYIRTSRPIKESTGSVSLLSPTSARSDMSSESSESLSLAGPEVQIVIDCCSLTMESGNQTYEVMILCRDGSSKNDETSGPKAAMSTSRKKVKLDTLPTRFLDLPRVALRRLEPEYHSQTINKQGLDIGDLTRVQVAHASFGPLSDLVCVPPAFQTLSRFDHFKWELSKQPHGELKARTESETHRDGKYGDPGVSDKRQNASVHNDKRKASHGTANSKPDNDDTSRSAKKSRVEVSVSKENRGSLSVLHNSVNFEHVKEELKCFPYVKLQPLGKGSILNPGRLAAIYEIIVMGDDITQLKLSKEELVELERLKNWRGAIAEQISGPKTDSGTRINATWNDPNTDSRNTMPKQEGRVIGSLGELSNEQTEEWSRQTTSGLAGPSRCYDHIERYFLVNGMPNVTLWDSESFKPLESRSKTLDLGKNRTYWGHNLGEFAATFRLGRNQPNVHQDLGLSKKDDGKTKEKYAPAKGPPRRRKSEGSGTAKLDSVRNRTDVNPDRKPNDSNRGIAVNQMDTIAETRKRLDAGSFHSNVAQSSQSQGVLRRHSVAGDGDPQSDSLFRRLKGLLSKKQVPFSRPEFLGKYGKFIVKMANIRLQSLRGPDFVVNEMGDSEAEDVLFAICKMFEHDAL